MHVSRRRLVAAAGCLAASTLAALAACSSDGSSGNVGPVELVLALLEGNAQSAVVHQPVPVRPAVKVTDANGDPQQGVSVSFSVVGGGGSVTGGSQATDATGVARVDGWTLGDDAGANSLRATVAGAQGSPVTFSATGTHDVVANVEKVAGDGQSATVKSTLPVAPSVRLTDQFGNVVGGAGVTFAVTLGDGVLSGATPVTGTDGVAAAGGWTLGEMAGSNAVSASVSGSGVVGNPAVFEATGLAGAPFAQRKVTGDGQTGTVGAALSVAPSVQVIDEFANPLAGVAVLWAVAQGGGSLGGASSVTDATGISTLGSWTLGQMAGANAVTATAAPGGLSGNPATFSATGLAGPPATMLKMAGDNQSATVGSVVAIPPAVGVADQYGNPVEALTIHFTVMSGGGSVTGADPATSAAGAATVGSWTLGAAAGANTLAAQAAGLSVLFSATGIKLLDPQQYAGTYSGVWNNTTFSSTGTGMAVISVNSAASTADVTVSATGSVLGTGSGMGPTLRTTAYGTTSASFQGNLPVMGDVTMTVDADGNLELHGTNIPSAGIVKWDATGTLTPTQIQLNFTVTFTAGPPAVGTIVLNHT